MCLFGGCFATEGRRRQTQYWNDLFSDGDTRQVATATAAPDPSDRLEQAQKESRRVRARQRGGRGGREGGGRDGWSADRDLDNSAVMNGRYGAPASEASRGMTS